MHQIYLFPTKYNSSKTALQCYLDALSICENCKKCSNASTKQIQRSAISGCSDGLHPTSKSFLSFSMSERRQDWRVRWLAGLTAKIFKHNCHQLLHHFHRFILPAWSSNQLSQQWNDANIVRIIKQTGHSSSTAVASHYSAISSTMSLT